MFTVGNDCVRLVVIKALFQRESVAVPILMYCEQSRGFLLALHM